MIASGPDTVGPLHHSIDKRLHRVLCSLTHIPHTPYIACLYESSVIILDQFTLLPVSDHVRTAASLQLHGNNVGIRAVGPSILLVHTANGYLLVFNVAADDSPLYEVFDELSDACIQSGVPVGDLAVKRPLEALMKSASTLLGGKVALPDLENIESFNNLAVEDQYGQFPVHRARVSIARVLNFLLGITNLWVDQSTSELLVFNATVTSASIQLYNLHSSGKSLFKFADLAWYTLDSPVVFSEYNQRNGSHVLVNGQGQVWLSQSRLLAGAHVWDLPEHCDTAKLKVAFNPQCDLAVLAAGECVYICKVHTDWSVLRKVSFDASRSIEWLPCGSILVLTSMNGDWRLCTKSGGTVFDSASAPHPDSLKASIVQVSPCCTRLWLATPLCLQLLNLLSLVQGPTLFTNSEIFIPVAGCKRLWPFPLLARFQHVLKRVERSDKNRGQFVVSRSANQLAISCGHDLAILSPYIQGGVPNHILWLNFKNLVLEKPWNIVRTFWFAGYLLVFNRGDAADEVIVLNTKRSQYVMGGERFVFDSDLILWRHQFTTIFSTIDCVETINGEGRALLVALDATVIALRLRTNVMIDSKTFPVYISVELKRDLLAVLETVSFASVQTAAQLGTDTLVFLLGNGDLVFVSDMGLAHLICEGTERFSVHTLYFASRPHTYILACAGHSVKVFDVKDLMHGKFEPIVFNVGTHQAIDLTIGCTENGKFRSIDLIYVENTVADKASLGTHLFSSSIGRKLVLHDLIRHSVERGDGLQAIADEYSGFHAYHHSLELVLYELLSCSSPSLARIVELISSTPQGDGVFVRCLRKIEAEHWPLFFDALGSTPTVFMAKLVDTKNVELCYTFLIVYLDYKRELLRDTEESLDERDCKLAHNIIKLLVDENRYEWAGELCRFIKILQPSNQVLTEVLRTVKHQTPADAIKDQH